MKLLINKSGIGAEELQSLTGSYYQNNDFSRIQTDWLLAQEDVSKLVGAAVMDRALAHYHSSAYRYPLADQEEGSGSAGSGLTDVDNELVYALQVPIAYKATLRYYQSNIVSHEDAGRKLKIDNQNEKTPWEWMMDRDDLAQVRKANETMDRCITFLEQSQVEEWLESDRRKMTRELFVNTTSLFHDAYPIDSSPRFFYTVTPFIREVQERKIKKALGASYAPLLAYWQSFADTEYPVSEGSGSGSGLPGIPEVNETYEELVTLVQRVVPLLVMVLAVKRLNVQVLPDGVVQTFKSMLQTRNASQAVTLDLVRAYCKELEEDAGYALDDIRRLLNASDPEALNYPLQPKNCETNKFFRF